ncbi:MAG: 50S ribosomal protein L19 [Patescibacteria group bacterium]
MAEKEQTTEKQGVEKAAIDPATIKPGMTVRVHQRIKDVNSKGEEKERIQIYEGIVLSKKGKTLENARILVRKISANRFGVEKLFPLASHNVVKVEIVKEAKVRRAKLYFLRNYKKRLRERKAA